MASQGNHNVYSVVVGIDFSEQSKRALMSALELARRSPPAVVHAVHAVMVTPVDGLPIPVDAYERDARERLEAFLAPIDFDRRIVRHVVSGTAPDVLCDLALEMHADVLVLGTHGRRGLSRVVFGSVAEATVRRAACSVMVVRDRFVEQEARDEGAYVARVA